MPALVKAFIVGFIPFVILVSALHVFVQWVSGLSGAHPDHVVHAILGAALVAHLFDRPTLLSGDGDATRPD